METEKAVEVDRAAIRSWRRNRDGGPQAVVLAVAVRHDHVEPVDGAALEERDQQLAPRARCRRGAREERWGEADGEHRHCSRLDEQASGVHGYFLWKSGEPSRTPRSGAGFVSVTPPRRL